MKPSQLTNRPLAPNRPPAPKRSHTILKKVLKPTILHRKRPSLTIAALKRHLAMSPEKNGIIQGNISGTIRNSLAIEGTDPEPGPSKTSSTALSGTTTSESGTGTSSPVDTLPAKDSQLEGAQPITGSQLPGRKKIVIKKFFAF